MSWIWAAFMPHPPIVIPEVGRGREKEAAVTLAGLKALQEKLRLLPDQGRPDVLLILSPHQPYAPNSLFINSAPSLNGNLGRFGAPEVSFNLNTSGQWSELSQNLAEQVPVLTGEAPDLSSDHGTIVPLYFLARAFGPPPEVLVANPIGLSLAQALSLGRTLAGWSGDEKKWALLASGDLSHRLRSDGPYGFNPEGPRFDQEVMEAFKNNTPGTLLADWPPARLEQAGECGFRSALTMMGLIGEAAEEISYEGPFGVGYGLSWWSPRQH